MIWHKHGLVWNCGELDMSGLSHAMAPTPFLLNDKIIRVYVTSIDSLGRGHSRYVDVSTSNPREVLNVASHDVLGPGAPGCFDDNGVMLLSITHSPDGRLFAYYAGFELSLKIRYRIFTGLAISSDCGTTFVRQSRAPILDRTDNELFFRGGSFVTVDEGRFRMWYVAGSDWLDLNGKSMPVYDLRYVESKDGICWPQTGRISLAITKADEHGFGRPWVVKRGANDYHLFYSVRRKSFSAYRLGYAKSKDGIDWVRQDEEMGLEVSSGGFDGKAIMYSAVIDVDGRTFCFYNGDDFGVAGFAVAELIA